MDYSQKAQAVLDAVEQVQLALANIPGITYEYYPSKRKGIVSVLNTGTMEMDKEAVLNIFWDQTSDKVYYTLHSYPNSNVPFESIRAEIDYDEDGVIEISDIISIALELFGALND